MKVFMLALCVAGLMAGCSDTADINGNANNGSNGGGGTGGNANNLQSFVVNNCSGVTGGDPMAINGATFPANDTDDPSQSVYTKNCIGG